MSGSDPEELSRLNARMDAEVRAEAAEYEQMALRTLLRGRDLTAVARELAVRGDEVEVHVGPWHVRGVISHAAGDLAIINGPASQTTDVHLTAVPLRVVRRVRAGGSSGTRGPAGFLARMTEHEIAATDVVLRLIGGEEVEGRIAAVARDHLWVVSRQHETAVPLPLVAAVGSPRRG